MHDKRFLHFRPSDLHLWPFSLKFALRITHVQGRDNKKFELSTAFYRAMYFSAKRGIAIACRLSVRPSVCLSVCNVGELWSHRLEFFENNFTIS